ncbi:SGNH/GDSL hydrolase family protein [Paenibacillus sp. 2TAB19]|uniref:SGNH/GDSL hydrolase family protein n=1 Tax=Paenibacillus sp. 2TAB19 TaxID=3233003 RepID=UPI003F9BF9F1
MNRWMGKSWATLGDSITEANGYQPIVAEALGFGRVSNYGRGGCPMTAGSDRNEGATVNVGRRLVDSYDCITVFAGVNDYRLSMPLGTLLPNTSNDYDDLTFIGAYCALIEGILSRDPSCRVNLWTPLQRDKDGYDTRMPNECGHLLLDYVQAVRAIGERYALPVLDLYAVSGFNAVTLPHFTSDGLHPNEAGHERIASLAIGFLRTI